MSRSACVLLVSILISACVSNAPSLRADPGGSASRPASDGTCPEHFASLSSGSCLLLPDAAGPDTPVILYLHGMYRADAPQAAMGELGRLGLAARQAGFAVLAPQGEVGLCDWKPELKSSWRCWPGRDAQQDHAWRMLTALGPDFVDTSTRLQRRAPLVPFLLGYSNGGPFAAFLATQSRQAFRAIAVLHGAPWKESRYLADRHIPTLLVLGLEDAGMGPLMRRLHLQMSEHGWDAELRTREGGHALADEDIRAALEFFASQTSHGE